MKQIYKKLGMLAWVLALVLTVAPHALAATPLVSSAKITSPKTVSIVFSEAVNTSMADYTNFTGGLYGRTLSTIAGSGTSTITLNFTGSPFAFNADGNMTIASSTVSVADKMSFNNGSISVSDGQTPKLLSLNLSLASNSSGDSLANANDAVTFAFTVTKPINAPKVTLDNRVFSATGTGTGPFSVTYNKTDSDAQGSVPFAIEMKDATGNGSTASGTLNLGAATVYVGQTTPTTAAVAATPSISQLSEVTAAADGTAAYKFNSATAGKINLTGDCSAVINTAVAGNNSLVFKPLLAGAHNNCTLTVTDSGGKTSNTIFIPSFTVGTAPAAAAAPPSPPASASVSVSGGFKFSKFLKKGMSGTEVLELQKRLVAEGFLKASPNGNFGSATEAAVKAYQKSHNLDQFGYIGPGTRAVLNGQ